MLRKVKSILSKVFVLRVCRAIVRRSRRKRRDRGQGILSVGNCVVWTHNFTENHEVPNVIFFNGKVSDYYQLSMWLKVFDDYSSRYAILTPSKSVLNFLQKKGLSVIHITEFKNYLFLKYFGVKNVFYVNNSMKNTHLVRYKEFNHVLILHGESDKFPSYNPVSKMYDLIFVAGEWAIDRYHKNLVAVPNRCFRIVGRPQVAKLTRIGGVSCFREGISGVVLYCTTWRGYSGGASTIDQAYKNIASLLSDGFRVVFRPHPKSFDNFDDKLEIDKIEGLRGEFGERITVVDTKFSSKVVSIQENFNHADVLISDMSSLVADWLYTLKPYFVLERGNVDELAMSPIIYDKSVILSANDPDIGNKISDVLANVDFFEKRKVVCEYVLGLVDHEDPMGKFYLALDELLEYFDKDRHVRDMVDESSRILKGVGVSALDKLLMRGFDEGKYVDGVRGSSTRTGENVI